MMKRKLEKNLKLQIGVLSYRGFSIFYVQTRVISIFTFFLLHPDDIYRQEISTSAKVQSSVLSPE